MTQIPGLTWQAFVAGSWHSAPTPELVRSEVSPSGVSFEWRAVGSAVYLITATGRAGPPGGLDVSCSCPDGAKQSAATATSGRLHVCKHAAAALQSVLDPAAVAAGAASEAASAARSIATKAAQEAALPGERQRLEDGLKQRTAEDVVSLLKSRLKTLEGLQLMSRLLPAAVLPPASALKTCRRCGEKWNPEVASQRVCRVPHPDGESTTRWDGSKKSWQECGACGKTHSLDGFFAGGRRKRDDEGGYCFEGAHLEEGDDEEEGEEEEEADEDE